MTLYDQMNEFDEPIFDEPTSEPAPHQELEAYLFEQFQEAALLRTQDMGRTSAHRGSPLRHVRGGDEAGTEHIVMKPPHPNDRSGEYVDVYAYLSTEPTDRRIEYGQRTLYLTGTYIVRVTDPIMGNQEWLVDDDGAHSTGFQLDEQVDIERLFSQASPKENARQLYNQRLGRYAVVFAQDETPPEAA